MLKLTEMLFAKLCMAENKKVSDSPIFGIAVWFSQYTVFTFFGTVLKTHIETEVGKVKQELKEDINSMNRKIENVQKSYDNLVSEKKDEDSFLSQQVDHCNVHVPVGWLVL
jgi:monomeric isocitrate dehydrogenase